MKIQYFFHKIYGNWAYNCSLTIHPNYDLEWLAFLNLPAINPSGQDLALHDVMPLVYQWYLPLHDFDIFWRVSSEWCLPLNGDGLPLLASLSFFLVSSEWCFPLCDSDIFFRDSSENRLCLFRLEIFIRCFLERCLPLNGDGLPVLSSEISLLNSILTSSYSLDIATMSLHLDKTRFI